MDILFRLIFDFIINLLIFYFMNTLMYFEQIINVALDEEFDEDGKLPDDFIESVIYGGQRHRREMKTNFIFFTEELKTDSETLAAVRKHQGKLIALMDKVFSYMPAADQLDLELPEEQNTAYLLKYLYQCLHSGLHYIERNFHRYIDHDISIPMGERISLSKRAREQLPLIIDAPRMNAIDKTLKDIVTKPLLQLVSDNEEKEVVTWRKKAYLEKLMKQLKSFVQSNDVSEIAAQEMQLHGVLQRINFNNDAYVNYMISVMDDEINEQRSHRDKCTRIIAQQRVINRYVTERKIAYDVYQMPLKDILLEWLNCELDCFESMIRLDAMVQSNSGHCLN